jgi:hypothetical protein
MHVMMCAGPHMGRRGARARERCHDREQDALGRSVHCDLVNRPRQEIHKGSFTKSDEAASQEAASSQERQYR